ncbi:hypothetical protein D3C73_1513880 [compost metagenome]
MRPDLDIELVPYTITTARAAPTKEYNINCKKEEPGKSAKQIAIAKLAPEFSPSKPESASGFRVIPCIIAPATAKQTPIKTPPRIRGRRISQII